MARNPFTTLPPADTTVRAGRLHARRADQAEQAVLLRRLRAHQRRQRATDASATCRRPHSGTATSVQRRRESTIRRPAMPTARGGRRSRTIRSLPIASAPIARRLLDKIPMPNIPGAPVGARSITRTRTCGKSARTSSTSSSPTRLRQNDNLSVRYSHQNARTLDPGDVRRLGRRQGLRRIGHQSDATTWPSTTTGCGQRRWSRKSASAGLSPQRRDHGGHGLNLADEIGIPGVNLNAFTSGTADDQHQQLSRLPVRASRIRCRGTAPSASGRWGRGDETLGKSHIEGRGRRAHQPAHAGPGDPPARRIRVPARHDGKLGGQRVAERFRQCDGRLHARCAVSIERGVVNVSDVYAPLDELHRGGRHKSVFTYVHDKWQLRPNITVDLGLRHEYYTPVVGFHDRGGMANYDPETNTLRCRRLRRHPRESWR